MIICGFGNNIYGYNSTELMYPIYEEHEMWDSFSGEEGKIKGL